MYCKTKACAENEKNNGLAMHRVTFQALQRENYKVEYSGILNSMRVLFPGKVNLMQSMHTRMFILLSNGVQEMKVGYFLIMHPK